MRRTVLRVIPLLILTSALPLLAFGQPYTFVPITLPRYSLCSLFEAFPTAINNRNQIVGYTRPLCDECCFPGSKNFLWDPTDGLRYVDLEGGGAFRGIDDAGVIWVQRCISRTCRPLKWVDGVVSELPTPPGARSTSISKVFRSGIVLMSTVQTDGRETLWSFDRGTYTELQAPAGVKIWTANEHGAIGGCKLLDSLGRTGSAYLRWPDSREIQPWPMPCQTFWNDGLRQGVSLLSAAGHFAGESTTYSPGGSPLDWRAFYGTADGRMWSAGRETGGVSIADMNNGGTLMGTIEGSVFTFREGVFTNVTLLTPNWPTQSSCRFSPKVINDTGFIAGGYCSAVVALLVPGTPMAPSLSFTVTGRTVSLNWTASLGASEYLLEVGSGPGVTDLYSASLGGQLSLTTPAPPGRFYVRVRARSPSGTSSPSNEVVIDVP